ncbi:hypothetical protein WN943_009759 [Citrus x changshan-huyou]
MLCKIINSQAPASTRVSSPPPESSKKRPHEAAVSPAKRDHDRQDPPDFRPPPPEFISSQQHLQNPIPTTAQKSLELPRPANKFARGVDLDYYLWRPSNVPSLGGNRLFMSIINDFSRKCAKTDKEKSEMAKVPYANAVEIVMNAMVLTRPNISDALSIKYRLLYAISSGSWRYVDSAFAEDYDRRKSLTGYRGSQRSFVAQRETAELGIAQETVEIHCDSSSAIYLSENPAHHERTKHPDVKLHYIRNEVSKGVIKMLKVHTNNNSTDMLTKVVPTAKFKVYLNMWSSNRHALSKTSSLDEIIDILQLFPKEKSCLSWSNAELWS